MSKLRVRFGEFKEQPNENLIKARASLFSRCDVVGVLWYEQLKINYIYIHYNT